MFVRARVVPFILILAVAAGCNISPASTIGPSQPPLIPLTVGLGYIPSYQFAPFYYAQGAGLYRQHGLDVTFQNKIDPDLVTLVGQGALDVGVADGTSVIPAVSQGIPIKYVATIYGTFPNVVFARDTSGIKTAADLKGKKIGTPGKYGSSWVMLQALLGSANLTTDDVQVVEYPDFGQGAAVQQGVVDAATGFTNNEPVQLLLAGVNTTSLHVDDVLALPGPGLIAGTATLAKKDDAIRQFVAATLEAMTFVAANPGTGIDATIAIAPDLAKTDERTRDAILNATIATWSSPNPKSPGYGWIDVDGWRGSIAYMTKLGLVPNPVTVDQLVDVTFVPAAGSSPSP